MARTPEGRVKDDIKRFLKTNGIWYFMTSTGGFGRSGVPDFVCCWNGRFLAIEAKAPGKRNNTTDLQDDEIAAIHKAGGAAIVVDDVQQLQPLLERYGREVP